MKADQIRLELPRDASYLSLVRLAATQLAAQSDFDVERIEDVRIAVGEAARILMAAPADAPAEDGADPAARDVPVRPDVLAVDFETGGGELTARLRRVDGGSAHGADEQSGPILEATTSRYRIGADGKEASEVTVGFDVADGPRTGGADPGGPGSSGLRTANQTEG